MFHDITVTCPKCLSGFLTIGYSTGSPGIGDDQPEPAGIEGIKSTCSCWRIPEVERMFAGVPYTEWLCDCVSVGGKGPNSTCMTWNREGSPCSHCSCYKVALPPPHLRVSYDSHPVLAALNELITVYFGIHYYYRDNTPRGFSSVGTVTGRLPYGENNANMPRYAKADADATLAFARLTRGWPNARLAADIAEERGEC